jgi:hypothetical protein
MPTLHDTLQPPYQSFKVEVQADASGQWCSNALRYATHEAAFSAGENLFMRWTAVREWRVTQSTDAPNR